MNLNYVFEIGKSFIYIYLHITSIGLDNILGATFIILIFLTFLFHMPLSVTIEM